MELLLTFVALVVSMFLIDFISKSLHDRPFAPEWAKTTMAFSMLVLFLMFLGLCAKVVVYIATSLFLLG